MTTRNGHYLGKDLITFSYAIILAHMGGCPLPVSMTLLATEKILMHCYYAGTVNYLGWIPPAQLGCSAGLEARQTQE